MKPKSKKSKNIYNFLIGLAVLIVIIMFISIYYYKNTHKHNRSPFASVHEEIILDPEKLKKIWTAVNWGKALPKVDFKTQAVVYIWATTPSDGYEIRMTGLEQGKDHWIIRWQGEAPPPGMHWTWLGTPAIFRIIPKPNKTVIFQEDPVKIRTPEEQPLYLEEQRLYLEKQRRSIKKEKF